LLGKILPPWSELKEKIIGVRDTIVNLWEVTAPVLNDMRLGWISFLEYVGTGLHRITKEGSGLRDTIKWIADDIQRTVNNIKQLFHWINKIGSIQIQLPPWLQFLGKEVKTPGLPSLSGVGDFLASQTRSFLPSYTPPLAGVTAGGSTQKNINVDSTINVSLPAGTPELHKRIVQESAKSAVMEIWNSELRQLISEQPNNE
jgi:hypothetical protein